MNSQTRKSSSVEVAAEMHFLSSIGTIKEAVVLANSSSVAVLGCGRCTDIPIRLLNEKFDLVDLIDIDSDALNIVSAECKRWNDEKNSYQFHCADLTGLIATVERRASELVANAVNPIECLEELGVLLETTAPEFWEPPQKQRYDFLICSTVLTQLQALVRESAENIYLGRFPEYASALLKHKPWCESLWNFARNLEDDFIEHLDKLVKPQGIIYLSATVHVSWLTQFNEQSVVTEGSWIATRISRLADYLRPSNMIIKEQQWDWLREEREASYWGRLYGVQAIIYRIP